MVFVKCIAAGDVLFCVPKENQKGRRCPQGMKAPVGLLSRRPVCVANAVCSAQQGHSDFDALDPRTRGCSPLVTPKLLGSIQKIQAAALEDFLCSADFKALQPLRRQLPAGERARPLPSAVCCPVPSREKRKPENPQIFWLSFYKKNRSAQDAQSEAEGILNRSVNVTQNDTPPVRSF